MQAQSKVKDYGKPHFVIITGDPAYTIDKINFSDAIKDYQNEEERI